MRGRFVSFLGAIGALGFVACASFGGEEGSSSSSSGSPNPNGQDGGPVVVATPGSLAVTFASPVRLVQGSSAKVHIKVAREGIAGTVTVTSKQLPEGIGLKPLELREGVSEGDLELTATTTAKQGDVKAALVIARSAAGTEADSPMQLFVRGPAGTRDTTFGTDGILDLGAATQVLSDASAQHLHVVVNNTLRRYARTGELDGTFPAKQLGPDSVFRLNALADGGTFFLLAHGTSYFVAKRNADGTLSTFGTGGEAATQLADIVPGWLPMGVTPAGQVLLGQSQRKGLQGQRYATFKRLGPNGSVDASFNYADYRPNDQNAFSYDLLPKPDGGAIAFVYVDTHTEVQSISPSGEVTGNHSLDDLAAFNPLETKAGVYFLGYRSSRVVGRLGPTLDLDPTFGNGGIATLPTPPPEELNDGYSIAVDGSDRVLVASFAKVLGSDQLVLARFTTAGKLDTTFSSSGYVTFPVEPSPHLRLFTVDGERMIVVGRYGGTANISRFWM